MTRAQRPCYRLAVSVLQVLKWCMITTISARSKVDLFAKFQHASLYSELVAYSTLEYGYKVMDKVVLLSPQNCGLWPTPTTTCNRSAPPQLNCRVMARSSHVSSPNLSNVSKNKRSHNNICGGSWLFLIFYYLGMYQVVTQTGKLL